VKPLTQMIVDVAISKTDMITFTHYIDSIPNVIFFSINAATIVDGNSAMQQIHCDDR
jgi:flagellar motor switch protein FliM